MKRKRRMPAGDTGSTSWSYERLLQLAPDAGTLEQARRLFFAKRWQTLAGNGEYLWGAYETAYGQRSQAVVRLEPPLFRCSCRSNRRPCKHALALVLLFLNRNEVWTVREQLPDWAVQQLGTTLKTTAPGVVNVTGQEKRIRLMDSGVAELDKWLRQLARRGLAHFLDAPEEWETLAVRMTDAKLGGMATRLRRARALLGREESLDAIVDEIGALYLFVRAWQRKASLQPDQKRELMQVGGWNLRRDRVLQEPEVKDNWLVLGLVTGTEEKLTYRRTWLRGERTGRYALLLDFAYGNRGFDNHWVTGSVLNGTLAYYPGKPKFRATWKNYQPSRAPYEAPAAYADFRAVQEQYAEALGASPWLHRFPVLVDEITPIYLREEETFMLVDRNRQRLPAVGGAVNWKLLAVSGGRPLSCFGEYDGRVFYPVSAISEGRVLLF